MNCKILERFNNMAILNKIYPLSSVISMRKYVQDFAQFIIDCIVNFYAQKSTLTTKGGDTW